MYQLEQTKQTFRVNPWKRPYEDRIVTLKDAKRCDKKTVAFLYPRFDSSTFRYRGYNVAETLEYSLWWSGAYFELGEIAELLNDIENVDVLVIIRCPWDDEFAEFVEAVKARGTKLCYDVDDLIYNPKHMPSVIEALGLDRDTEWNFWFGLTQRNYLIVEMCDAMITTNEYLARYLRADFNKPCYIIKNYLNWIQEEVSTEYYEAKQNMIAEKPFEIGYFSGSPTHVNDIMMIMPEVEEFLTRHEDTRMKIVGYMNLPQEYKYLVDQERIQFVPFQTFVGLQYQQAKVDVNVVPLINNDFSNCKSELKYFETAIVGTITCATPSHAYSNAITNGENGYLCENGEWLPVFEKLYEEGVQKEQREYIRNRALESYSYKNQLDLVENVFENVLKS